MNVDTERRLRRIKETARRFREVKTPKRWACVGCTEKLISERSLGVYTCSGGSYNALLCWDCAFWVKP